MSEMYKCTLHSNKVNHNVEEFKFGATWNFDGQPSFHPRLPLGNLAQKSISYTAVDSFIFVVLILLNSPYLNWDYNDPEKAVLGVAIHSFEWMFIRIAPVIFIGLLIGIFFTRKKN